MRSRAETWVVGVDLASAKWVANGSAALTFGPGARRWGRAMAPAIRWPAEALSPSVLARAIDRYAMDHGVKAIALDGPQGWRDPGTTVGAPGVGRRCEYCCRTQGKTGTRGIAYPRTQLGWIEFCIETFDALIGLGNGRLAEAPESVLALPARGYWLAECFPTWTWREAGLAPLPAKSKRPSTSEYWARLREAFALPEIGSAPAHDDLQAVVAAIAAAAMIGGPARATRYGVTSSLVAGHRVEGYIWSVRPLVDSGCGRR